MLPIIHTYSPDRIKLARWGFWPEEWKRSKHSHTMINANPETTAEKPMFASSFRKTKANGGVSYSHERMSVILSLGRGKAWLPPHPTELLTRYLVTPKVNRTTLNEPRGDRARDVRDY